MKQILTRLLIFAICCIMCIHTFSICTRSVIYILLAIILAFGTMLIADRLSPTAPVLIHVGIFILCCLCLKFVVFLPLFCFYLSRRPVCFTAPIGVLSIILASAKLPMDTAMNSIRSSVHDLHDESIDTKAAIQDMLNDITGFHTSFEYDMGNIVPKDIKYCLISIAKEAITNAVKHSNGDQLSILIREHPGFYQLTIRDNGTGIHLTTSPGIGLTNIQERVQSLSGTLQISTESGFRLFVSIPKYTQKGDRTA